MREESPTYTSSAFLILPDEKVIFRTHPHWLIFAGPEVCVGILAFLLIKYLPILLEDMNPSLMLKIYLILGGTLVFCWRCDIFRMALHQLLFNQFKINR